MKKIRTKKIKVFWDDAIIYSYKSIKKDGRSLSKKITIGNLIKETSKYIIIKSPTVLTFNDTKKIYMQKENSDYSFFFIPKGMIKKIEYIKK